MLLLIIAVTILLPLAWLFSEAQRHRWISVVLGCMSLAWIGFISYGYAAFFSTISLNTSFGEASKSLATTIVQELEAGNVDHVTQELAHFSKNYQPNYENYPRYDAIIFETVQRLQQDEPASHIPSHVR